MFLKSIMWFFIFNGPVRIKVTGEFFRVPVLVQLVFRILRCFEFFQFFFGNGMAGRFYQARSKYRGYWNYYGVIGDYDSLQTFYYRTIRILFKWLNRRSQRLSYNWTGFKDLLKQFLIPAPKITEKYPYKQLKFCV